MPRIGVVGEISTGKSALINALCGSVVARSSLGRETQECREYMTDTGNIALVDFPGLNDTVNFRDEYRTNIRTCDLLLFVTSAERPLITDSENRLLTFIQELVADTPHQPDILLVVNKFDTLNDDEYNTMYSRLQQAHRSMRIYRFSAHFSLHSVLGKTTHPDSIPEHYRNEWRKITRKIAGADPDELAARGDYDNLRNAIHVYMHNAGYIPGLRYLYNHLQAWLVHTVHTAGGTVPVQYNPAPALGLVRDMLCNYPAQASIITRRVIGLISRRLADCGAVVANPWVSDTKTAWDTNGIGRLVTGQKRGYMWDCNWDLLRELSLIHQDFFMHFHTMMGWIDVLEVLVQRRYFTLEAAIDKGILLVHARAALGAAEGETPAAYKARQRAISIARNTYLHRRTTELLSSGAPELVVAAYMLYPDITTCYLLLSDFKQPNWVHANIHIIKRTLETAGDIPDATVAGFTTAFLPSYSRGLLGDKLYDLVQNANRDGYHNSTLLVDQQPADAPHVAAESTTPTPTKLECGFTGTGLVDETDDFV